MPQWKWTILLTTAWPGYLAAVLVLLSFVAGVGTLSRIAAERG